MRLVPGLLLILTLAACAKQEPPPVAPPAPTKPATALAKATPAPGPVPVAPAAVTAASPSPAPVAAAAPEKPAVVVAATQPAPAIPLAPQPAVAVKSGETIFTENCATCHMADGNGVPYMQPAIKGSAWISNPDPQLLLSLILRGAVVVMGAGADAWDNKMPPFENLTDPEIAAVATYVRSRFAATPITPPVTPAQVAIARKRPGLPE